MICWFTDKKLKPRARFHLRHMTNDVRASVTDLLYKVDITTFERKQEQSEFGLNDIGCIRLRTATPLHFDPYAQNRITGSFVLVDEQIEQHRGRRNDPGRGGRRDAGERRPGSRDLTAVSATASASRPAGRCVRPASGGSTADR